MKNNYAWALIIVVLVIAAGAIWFMMNKTNMTLDNANATTTPAGMSTTHASGSTGTKGVTTTTTGGTTVTGDVRPVITSINPSSAKIGDIVAITGVNFDATGNNIVTFGPSKGLHHSDGSADNQVAALPAANGNTITFKVPSSIESGTLCTQAGVCSTYGPSGTTPGAYMVTVVNKNGLSNEFSFTVTN